MERLPALVTEALALRVVAIALETSPHGRRHRLHDRGPALTVSSSARVTKTGKFPDRGAWRYRARPASARSKATYAGRSNRTKWTSETRVTAASTAAIATGAARSRG